MGKAVLVIVVDVAGSGLEPRASVTVRDGFLDLPNFLTKRFISLNSRFWYLVLDVRQIKVGDESQDVLGYISTFDVDFSSGSFRNMKAY